MALKTFKPYTKSTRGTVIVDKSALWKGSSYKPLTKGQSVTGGRNNNGRITSRHQGGGQKHKFRIIDFLRKKKSGQTCFKKHMQYMRWDERRKQQQQQRRRREGARAKRRRPLFLCLPEARWWRRVPLKREEKKEEEEKDHEKGESPRGTPPRTPPPRGRVWPKILIIPRRIKVC